mmetsp:Transcript_29721/g.45577  ORF Transcript_29721/g.45577 Transcript_29721/m.45577 type:complete len:241 (+) Transcript_29721:406-1128(+)
MLVLSISSLIIGHMMLVHAHRIMVHLLLMVHGSRGIRIMSTLSHGRNRDTSLCLGGRHGSGRTTIGGRDCGRHNGLLCSSLGSHILLHFVIETNLVLGGHIFVFFLLVRCQGTPPFAHNGAHFHKLHSGEFLEDLGTHIKGKKDKRSTSAFGGIGILDLFDLPVDTMIFNHVTLRIVSRWRDIILHLQFVPLLVFLGTHFPLCLFFRSQTLVHGRCILGQLSKRHAGILTTELFTHGILI